MQIILSMRVSYVFDVAYSLGIDLVSLCSLSSSTTTTWLALTTGVQLDAMCSTINPEGILVIRAPIREEQHAVEAPEKERPIAIQHE